MKELRDLSNRDGKQINQINIWVWALRGHWSSWRSFTLVNLRIFKQNNICTNCYLYLKSYISNLYNHHKYKHTLYVMNAQASIPYPSKSSTLHMFTDFQLPARPGSDSKSENLRPRHPCGKTQRPQASTSGPGLKMEGMGVWDMFTLFWQKRILYFLFWKSCSGSMHVVLLNTVFGSGIWLCWGIPAPATSTSHQHNHHHHHPSSSSWLTAGPMDGCEGWMDQWSSGAPTNLSIADLLSHFRSDHGS